MNEAEFQTAFATLTGNPPFPWQRALYQRFLIGDFPVSCTLPTGLGKTSVIHLWLLALAHAPDLVPRRLVYVVNRRTVVDQSTEEARKLRERISLVDGLTERLRGLCAVKRGEEVPLGISTLRGQFADNREWSLDPARPAVIAGTVDMIGSRLLFSGYGIGYKARPLHAGFLGQDSLIVHDEAHLEPAFQQLLTAMETEQRTGRCPDFRPMRVMELTATSRSAPSEVFTLTEKDTTENEIVQLRIHARKGILFHPVKADKGVVASKIAELAVGHKDSGQAILVFVRTIDDVNVVARKLDGIKANYRLLTGTIRGLERDALVMDPVFRRFRPGDQAGAATGTVYVISTSAGEVGIDISADHLVCDLTPFDSMAQRFGRVNRRGGHDRQARIDIIHEAEPDPKKKDDAYDQARQHTLKFLQSQLSRCEWDPSRHEVSPAALGTAQAGLPLSERSAMYTPWPDILPVTDILFDSWALTTIREALPGRPEVADWLHGVTERDPPETHVAWRDEVDRLQSTGLTPKQLAELLEDYALKPHELLRDASHRVRAQLVEMSRGKEEFPVWLVSSSGEVTPLKLGDLVALNPGGGRSDYQVPIERYTIVMPPSAGGLTRKGMLGSDDPAERWDVADEWRDEQGRRLRIRLEEGEPIPPELGQVRLLRKIDTSPEEDADDDGAEGGVWKWYVRVRAADDGAGSSASKEQMLAAHLGDTEEVARAIAGKLLSEDGLQRAVTLAARWHDLGKRRALWQKNMGNDRYPAKVIAKTGHSKPPREWIDYRHELGSLLDLRDERQDFRKDIEAEPPQTQDLILHLIAVHHGRGRPHFPEDEVYDPALPR